MGEIAIKSKKYSAYKIIRTVFYICLIPLLLMAIFAGYVMIKSKSMGGYPSAFGYTVIEIKNNNFYNVNDNKYIYKQGEKQLFQKNDVYLYEFDSIIAYYSGSAEDTEAYNDSIEWRKDSALNANRSLFRNTATTETQAEVSIGQIIDISEPTLIGNKKYVLLAIANNQNDNSNYVVIVAEDIIGQAVMNSDFLINTLEYCSNIQGFITLMVIPCALLLILNILKAIVLSKFLKEDISGQKQKYLKQETEREGGFESKNKHKQIFAQEIHQNPETQQQTESPPIIADASQVPESLPLPDIPQPPIKPQMPQKTKVPVRPIPVRQHITGPNNNPKIKMRPNNAVNVEKSTQRTIPIRPQSLKTGVNTNSTNIKPVNSKPPTPPRKPPVRPF